MVKFVDKTEKVGDGWSRAEKIFAIAAIVLSAAVGVITFAIKVQGQANDTSTAVADHAKRIQALEAKNVAREPVTYMVCLMFRKDHSPAETPSVCDDAISRGVR